MNFASAEKLAKEILHTAVIADVARPAIQAFLQNHVHLPGANIIQQMQELVAARDGLLCFLGELQLIDYGKGIAIGGVFSFRLEGGAGRYVKDTL